MRTRSTPRLALLAPAFALLSLSLGCDTLSEIGPSTCDRSAEANEPITYTEGTVDAGVYMSSAWDGELLYFPGGMRYTIEHKLGDIPRWWLVYLSFDRYGADTGTLAQAAGNQAEVIDVNMATLTVVNGSCSEYWMLLVAGGVEGGPEAPP